jgi:hypothetical protein
MWTAKPRRAEGASTTERIHLVLRQRKRQRARILGGLPAVLCACGGDHGPRTDVDWRRRFSLHPELLRSSHGRAWLTVEEKRYERRDEDIIGRSMVLASKRLAVGIG